MFGERADVRQSCCIKISDFPMRCEELRDPSLHDVPYMITRDRRIAHISPLAVAMGVSSRMSVSLVKAVYPSVRILPYDSDLYFSIHRDFLDAYADSSPFVEPLGDGEVFIDLTGVRDEVVEVRQMVDRVRVRSRLSGVFMTLCSSTSKMVSRIGANLAASVSLESRRRQFDRYFGRYVRDSGADFVFLKIGDESKADFIKMLPVQYLWLADRDDLDKLYQLGVKRIGDIGRVPIDVLASRIGDSAYRIHELSYGIDSTPVYPCYPEMELREVRTFESGVAGTEGLIAVIDDILESLIKRLTDMSMTTSSLGLGISVAGMDEVTSYDKKLKHPTASQRYIGSVLRQMVSKVAADICSGTSGFAAIEEIAVRFKGIQIADTCKIDLFDDMGRKEREQQLEKVMLSIEGRFGSDRIELAGELVTSRRDQLRAILDPF